MNAPACATTLAASLMPPLHALALGALPQAAGDAADSGASAEAGWLRAQRVGEPGLSSWHAWAASPPPADRLLHTLATGLPLRPVEVIAVALAVAAELDASVARVVAWLQAPAGTSASSRPNVGLLLALAQALGVGASAGDLLDGSARATGLLLLEMDADPAAGPRATAAPVLPLVEQSVQVPLPLALLLRDGQARWPGVALLTGDEEPAPASLREAAARQAAALRLAQSWRADAAQHTSGPALVVRAGHPRVARAAAAWVAQALGQRAAVFDSDAADRHGAGNPAGAAHGTGAAPRGSGLWLVANGALPVWCVELAPGETRHLPSWPGYRGPVLVACGPDGCIESDGDTLPSWRVPLPLAGERSALWLAVTGDAALAAQLGTQQRHDAARIRLLGRAARHQAHLEGVAQVGWAQLGRAARQGVAADLGTLAELMPEAIDDAALVVSPALGATLAALQQRCQCREGLTDGLGPAARARYRPGVRSLFVGPSGTGKTLAAGWLATRLGLPLYRVDVASVSSKYIGETEKNLSQLFARAEHAEVVLLFDEADALFGKRTEVKESNDRHANAQTNYLLQRIESFEGIAILTSNSRSRFDSAFTRRLDAIVDFPAPTPQERHALWRAHLGETQLQEQLHGRLHARQQPQRLDVALLNRIASSCDLAGGHIRNAVLAAAACAHAAGGAITEAQLLQAIAAEYQKLGKALPAGLAERHGATPRPPSDPQESP